MAGYSRADYESEMDACEVIHASLIRAQLAGEISGLQLLKGDAALDAIRRRAKGKLTAIARAIEDRARDDWRDGHVTQFPAQAKPRH